MNNEPSGSLNILVQPYISGGPVNSNTAGRQWNSQVTALPDGGWLVTWEPFGDVSYVYGVRYDANGLAVSSDLQLTYSAGGGHSVDIAQAAFNRQQLIFVVHDYNEVYYATLDLSKLSDGLTQGGGWQRLGTFVSEQPGMQSMPAVTSLSGGGWKAAWLTLDSGIYAGSYTERYLVGSSYYYSDAPSIDGLLGNKYVVTWGGVNDDIYANIYDGADTFIASIKVNSYDLGLQKSPSVASLRDGGFVVVWQSMGQDGSQDGIYAQIFNEFGSQVGSEFRVNTNTSNAQVDPVVSVLSDGGWVIVWSSYLQDGSGWGIYGQRYDSNGNPVGLEFKINSQTIGSQDNPSVEALIDGGWVVTWTSKTLDESNWDIFSQRYNANGQPIQTYNVQNIVAKQASDFTEGKVIYADIGSVSDVDGVGSISWQWQRSEDGGVSWFDIPGATGSSYVLADEDSYNIVRLKGTYIDGQGFANTVYSAASSPIINIGNPPIGNLQMLKQVDLVVSTPATEFLINNYTANDQTDSQVIALADGGWLVVWESSGQDLSGLGIYAQRYNSSGDRVGNEFRVNSKTTGSQEYPTATSLSDGGFLVVWSSLQDGFIYGQRYDNLSNAVSSEFLVNTHTASGKGDPSVTSLIGGGWIIVWESYQDYVSTDGTSTGIYGQRYDQSGAKIGNEFRINTYTKNEQIDPVVTALSDGGWVVTWASLVQDGSAYGTYGQRYNSSGAKVGVEFQINTYTLDSQLYPSITALPDGGWLVVWSSRQDGSDYGIYGQRYDSSGVKFGSEFLINVYNLGRQINAVVTTLTDGGWLVTWNGEGAGDSSGVYGQRYDSLGVKVGTEFLINSFSKNDQVSASVAALTDGGWIVTWQSYFQDGSGSGIYGQRYDSYGNKAYTRIVKNYVVTEASDFTEDKMLFADASMVSDTDGMGVISWQWQRSSDGGINWDDIAGATADNYSLSNQDAGRLIRLKGTYTDGQGFLNTVYSSASTPVININDAPVGFTASISGTATEDQVLTASAAVVSDADGLADPVAFSYQWQRSNNGTTWTDVAGATARSYSLGDADVGYKYRVVVRYTDGQGTVESTTSSATLAVGGVEDEATGALSVTGTAEEGGSLTASLSGASDLDGAITGTAYQWQISSDGTTWTDISGATSATYNLASDQSQVGKFVRVVVTTTDVLGGTTTFTGDSSEAISNVDDESTATLSVTGTPIEGGSLTASLTGAVDPDGAISGTSYQWQISANGTVWSDLFGATSATYNLASDQSEVGQFVRVVVTTTDVLGGTTAYSGIGGGVSAVRISNAEDEATATLSVTGTAEEGGSLTASLSGVSDPDGAITGTAYQWQVSSDGLSWTNISGATSATYNLASDQSQVGKFVRVVVTTTDALGGTTTFTGDSSAAITNIEEEATGTLSVTGTAEEGGSLTASLTGASDPDGAITGTAYQWQISSDGTLWTNISDATSATYNLASDQSQVGKFVRVEVTTTDALGGTTAFTSASSVVANVNDAPVGFVASISGTATEDQVLAAGAAVVSDADGLADPVVFSYQWQRSSDGSTWTDVAGATGSTYALGDADVGQKFRVIARYADGQGTVESIISTGTSVVANVNDSPVGGVTLSGQANERQTLSAVTAGLSDPDGLGSFSYQWQSSTDGVLWSALSSATGSTYTLTTADIGNQVRVVVSYTDAFGAAETVTSSPSAVVAELVVNEVTGTSGADTLTGVAGVVNVYTGGAGNDSITGKDRADVAVFTGNRSDYTVTTVAGVITVVDNRPGSPDGTDTIRGMNILRFADSQLFVTAAANRTTLAGVAQTFEVANSEFVTGTAAAERFIIQSGVSAFVSAGTGDTVDLSGAITDYTYKASGNQLQISDGVNTTVLTVGGAFTLRTASGSTPVVLDFAAGGVIKLGAQVVGSAGFDPAAAITNAGNTSAGAQGVSTTPPTVTALTGSSDTAPTITGTAVLGDGQTLEVTVNGTTYTTATGVVLGAGNTWSLTLPSALPAGTYEVQAVLVRAIDAVNAVTGTSGADTLTGMSGVVNVYTGGGGNDSITGKDRADVAVFTGNRSDYTVTTVAGVVTVVDNRPGSPDGTDTLRGMNILRFADSQLFVTAAANRTTLAGVAQTFEVANSEFVTGTAAAEHFIIRPGVSAFVSAGTGDTVDLSGAVTDYTYKASGNQLQISDGVNTTVLTVGGAFTLRTASGSTPVVLDFAAGGVIKLGTQVVGSAGFDPLAAITNAGNVSDNAIPEAVTDTSSNELVIAEPLAPMGLSAMAVSMSTSDGSRATPSILPIADTDQLQKVPVIAMPVQDELERLLGAGIDEFIQNPGSGPSYGGFPALAEDPFARQIMDVEWPAYSVLPQEAHVALVI